MAHRDLHSNGVDCSKVGRRSTFANASTRDAERQNAASPRPLFATGSKVRTGSRTSAAPRRRVPSRTTGGATILVVSDFGLVGPAIDILEPPHRLPLGSDRPGAFHVMDHFVQRRTLVGGAQRGKFGNHSHRFLLGSRAMAGTLSRRARLSRGSWLTGGPPYRATPSPALHRVVCSRDKRIGLYCIAALPLFASQQSCHSSTAGLPAKSWRRFRDEPTSRALSPSCRAPGRRRTRGR